MGVTLEFTGADGRKYPDFAAMMKAETDKVFGDLVSGVERAVSAQRCAVHGQTASVSVRRSADKISFDITGCCDALVQRAERAAEAA